MNNEQLREELDVHRLDVGFDGEWWWAFASMVLLRNMFFIYGSGSFTKAFAVFRYCPSDDVLYQKYGVPN